MDLSKAFDTLPHELIVLKLKEYGADEATTALIRDYLSNRFQRVRLGDTLSNWQSISNAPINSKLQHPPPPGIPRAFDCASCPGRREFERCVGRVGNLNQTYRLF